LVGAAGPTEPPATGAVAAPDHDPARRLLLARGAAIFAGLTATGVVGYGVRTALGPPRLDRVRIPLAKLPRSMDGLRIATVSDIHLGPLRGRAHTERIVAAINRLDADLVAVVGDLVDGSVAELGSAAEPLRGLRSRYGSFFVTGNHEYYSGVEEWVQEVDRLGLRVLQNQRQEIQARGGVLDLAGVNDLTGEGTGLAAGPDFATALGDRDPSRPVVLLAHQPLAAKEAARYGVDLQLSGHTHGGQMVPFNLAVKLEQPVVSGLGEVDGTKVYVTNGAGFWGPPVRVGAEPQISLVELRSA
ncbi:metallophosphoesterase, partial [Micromonospora tarensis]